MENIIYIKRNSWNDWKYVSVTTQKSFLPPIHFKQINYHLNLIKNFDKKPPYIYRCVLFRLLEPRLKYWFWQILIWIFVDPSCRLGRADGQRGESQSPILSRRNKLSQKGKRNTNNFLIERTMQDIRFVCCVWRLDLDALGKWSQQVDIDYACLLCLAIIYSLSIIASTACKEIVSKISKKKWRSTVYWYY